jgi:hypothetical protein
VVVGGGITELAPLHKGNSGDALDYWDRMIFLRPSAKSNLQPVTPPTEDQEGEPLVARQAGFESGN